jgi:predicted ATPase
MLIKAIILENFRAYKTRTVIPASDLTVFIGKNDSGKSTILEALDIFFESGTVKIESADASKGGDPKNVRIAVIFTELPPQLVLDSNAVTTLANEYLLNADGNLEIHKVFNCAIQTPKAAVFARAVHPTAKDAADTLQKVQKDLKAVIKDKGLEKNCNQTENPSMRYAIYQAHPGLQLQPRDVPLNDDNAKAIWGALQNYLPIYALFQSDRPSNDQDPEVQNPMKVAIEQALDQLTVQLDAITDQVREKAQETAARTLAKLQASYPNLASTLQPKFKKPLWKSIFKLDLETDDGIPLNKRGSGVRRLVLLSFFQAEAEKRRAAAAGAPQPRRVVYAIEEPETSQHPDSQEQIIGALRELAAAGDQILLTTHVPALAGLVPLNSLRYVDQVPDTLEIRIRAGSPDVYVEIADALGVLPDPVRRTGLKVAVLVEGKNDIDALRSMAMVLAAAGEVGALDDAEIFWTIGGGDSTLKDWIERRYLDKLGIHQIIIQDSDRSAAAIPLSLEKVQWLKNMQALANVTAFITNKRNMDNYVHPAAIVRMTGGKVTLTPGVDVDYVRMADELAGCFTTAKAAGGLAFTPDDHDGKPIAGTGPGPCKRIISAYFMRHMTAAEIGQRALYQDGAGAQRHEVREWIEAIRARLQ